MTERKRGWTPAEDRVLLDSSLPARALAAQIGRSKTAIDWRRQWLRRSPEERRAVRDKDNTRRREDYKRGRANHHKGRPPSCEERPVPKFAERFARPAWFDEPPAVMLAVARPGVIDGGRHTLRSRGSAGIGLTTELGGD